MDFNSTVPNFDFGAEPIFHNTQYYPPTTYYSGPRTKTTTTVREYDKEGRLVKETITVTEPTSAGYDWYTGGTTGYGQTIKTTETNE